MDKYMSKTKVFSAKDLAKSKVAKHLSDEFTNRDLFGVVRSHCMQVRQPVPSLFHSLFLARARLLTSVGSHARSTQRPVRSGCLVHGQLRVSTKRRPWPVRVPVPPWELCF